MNKFFRDYYKQLKDYTIAEFVLDKDEVDEWPTFILKHPKKETLKISVSCDEEGNHSGFLFIEVKA